VICIPSSIRHFRNASFALECNPSHAGKFVRMIGRAITFLTVVVARFALMRALDRTTSRNAGQKFPMILIAFLSKEKQKRATTHFVRGGNKQNNLSLHEKYMELTIDRR
jgi:hypothetical protein